MTRAPASARRDEQYGAATACSRETTRRLARGRVFVILREVGWRTTSGKHGRGRVRPVHRPTDAVYSVRVTSAGFLSRSGARKPSRTTRKSPAARTRKPRCQALLPAGTEDL